LINLLLKYFKYLLIFLFYYEETIDLNEVTVNDMHSGRLSYFIILLIN